MTAPTPTVELTPASEGLFETLVKDAGNWSGNPLLGGNFEMTPALKGNVTDLKQKGLIETQVDPEDPEDAWVYFTTAGRAEAVARYGIDPDPDNVANN